MASSAAWRTTPPKNWTSGRCNTAAASSISSKRNPSRLTWIKRPSRSRICQAVRRALDDPLVDFLCLSQRFLATLAFGDVGLGAGQRDGAAFAVSCGAAAGNEPADAAITMQHPVLGLIEGGVAGNMRLGALEDCGRVVGMDEASAILELIADLVILITEHLLQDRIDVDLLAFRDYNPIRRRRPPQLRADSARR